MTLRYNRPIMNHNSISFRFFSLFLFFIIHSRLYILLDFIKIFFSKQTCLNIPENSIASGSPSRLPQRNFANRKGTSGRIRKQERGIVYRSKKSMKCHRGPLHSRKNLLNRNFFPVSGNIKDWFRIFS